jgi:hypothetical protein
MDVSIARTTFAHVLVVVDDQDLDRRQERLQVLRYNGLHDVRCDFEDRRHPPAILGRQ